MLQELIEYFHRNYKGVFFVYFAIVTMFFILVVPYPMFDGSAFHSGKLMFKTIFHRPERVIYSVLWAPYLVTYGALYLLGALSFWIYNAPDNKLVSDE